MGQTISTTACHTPNARSSTAYGIFHNYRNNRWRNPGKTHRKTGRIRK
jgi:hypothetical protein